MAGSFHGVQNLSSSHLRGLDVMAGKEAERPLIDSSDSEAGEDGLVHPICSSPSGCHLSSPLYRQNPSKTPPSDEEQMKERFSKLLLGEDMSGGGKGVSSALALSNAITNLGASVFGEQLKLEPMSTERKEKWRKEVDWLLAVTDYIVEFVPSQQTSNDGTEMEIMVTRQRNDLRMNIPALRKLDAMLLDCLDNFKGQNEFWYGSKDDKESEDGGRKDNKWWLPTVKVPPEGLSSMTQKWLLFQKESVSQVLKAAMAINTQVLSEMTIPENYIESLPKNGKTSLGDMIYKSITVEYFDPEEFLSTLDMSTEHKVLDLKNRIEASINIWRKKMNKDGRSSWGSTVSVERRELFEERAETILLLLKLRFPGLPQSSLDISKIQYNLDIGQSILESYSRVIESLANTVTSRIEDILYVHALAQNSLLAEPKTKSSMDAASPEGSLKFLSPKNELERLASVRTPTAMTLLDFMGWHVEQKVSVENQSEQNSDELIQDGNFEDKSKQVHILPNINVSYIEKLEHMGETRSPTACH